MRSLHIQQNLSGNRIFYFLFLNQVRSDVHAVKAVFGLTPEMSRFYSKNFLFNLYV